MAMAAAVKMWVRDFGVFLTAVLLTVGPACAQAGPTVGDSVTAVDWLSPESLAWTNPDTFNWTTSPVKLNAHEYGSYNNNILGAAVGTPLPGTTRGDYLLTSTVGVSTRFTTWSQQFFSDANYTAINYRHNIGFDGHNYSVDAGVNYIVTTRCTGKLIASSNQRQAPQEELFGPGIATIRTQSIAESGNCKLYQDISAVLNGAVTSTNQTSLGGQSFGASALDNITSSVQGGLQYQWTGVDNLLLLTKISDTRYTNHVVVTAAEALRATGLLSARFVNYTATYNRTFSDLFNMSATAGLATISQETRTGSGSPTTTPTYALTAQWLPTPKWTFQLNASRTVSPPVSILAGTQVGDAESVVARYYWTPKLSLSATISRSYLAGARRLSNTVTQVLGGYGANTLLSIVLAANYQITPFTSATISVQKTNRAYSGQSVSTEILLFGLDYQPQ